MNWHDHLSSAIDEVFDAMVQLRRHLHRHPELSGHETETTQYLTRLLQANDVDVRLGPDGRGIIADLSSGAATPCIALRADIDALPIQDEKNVTYASQRAGVMHACGHDAHAALVFGAFRSIQSLAQRGVLPFVPRVRAIFQPAEEICAGAKEMIAAGAIDGVDAILAVHMDPTRAVGRIGLRSGVLTASCDELVITINGHGGHAARPHEARDPILAAAQLVNDLYEALPRSPDGPASDDPNSVVLTICRVEGGHASNVIPANAKLWGTMRTLDGQVRERALQRISEVAQSVGNATNTEIDVAFGVDVDSVVNDPGLCELLRETVVVAYGQDAVEAISSPSMGSEDFAFYGAKVPACMMRLGCVSDRVAGGLLHTPSFDIDEEVLRIGARLMADAAIRWLTQQTTDPSATAAEKG